MESGWTSWLSRRAAWRWVPRGSRARPRAAASPLPTSFPGTAVMSWGRYFVPDFVGLIDEGDKLTPP